MAVENKILEYFPILYHFFVADTSTGVTLVCIIAVALVITGHSTQLMMLALTAYISTMPT